jgi:DNA-binding CsgD family transcriptional regulator
MPTRTTRIDEIMRASRANFRLFRKDLAEMRTMLDRHSGELTEHKRLIDDHTAKLASLEQRLTVSTATLQKELSPVSRPILPTSLPIATNPPMYSVPQRHNIDSFSPQEKRILSLFFENPGMALSYVDIAKVLGKSANTVKNQMHQLGMKADLFERTIDNTNRNRFKLKEGLKIDRFLNIN